MLSRDEIILDFLERLPYPPYPIQEEAMYAWASCEQGMLLSAPTWHRRDLKQVLAGQWKLPVCYDRSKREWYFDGEAAPLPSTVVSDTDRFALLLSLQSVEQYRVFSRWDQRARRAQADIRLPLSLCCQTKP